MKGEGNFAATQELVSWKHGRRINNVDSFVSCKDVTDEGREVVENVKEINLKDVYWTVQAWEEVGEKILSLSWRKLLRGGDKLMMN
jgi:hypothetical protein